MDKTGDHYVKWDKLECSGLIPFAMIKHIYRNLGEGEVCLAYTSSYSSSLREVSVDTQEPSKRNDGGAPFAGSLSGWLTHTYAQ